MSETAVRIDIWLWRARFAKTRSIAAALVERGAVRLTHNGVQTRLDKPSRTFVINARVTSLRVEALGERRGPAEEARALYADLTPPESVPVASD